MGFWVLVFVVVVWVLVKLGGSSTGYAKLMSDGIPARGILLSVSSTSSGSVGSGLTKLQQRDVRIDIEAPGAPPYEAQVTLLVPLGLVRDVLPGATVELRIARNNPKQILVAGPGVGFNAAGLRTQGQLDQGAA